MVEILLHVAVLVKVWHVVGAEREGRELDLAHWQLRRLNADQDGMIRPLALVQINQVA